MIPMRSILSGITALLLFACVGAQAFDEALVRAKIDAAMPKPMVANVFAAGAADPGVVSAERQQRMMSEQDAAYALMKTCEGRFNALQGTLRKQVSRSEWISGVGGGIGVLGAVATCPHCAALAAGIAGLANPLQQTFRDNFDSPQDTRDLLQKLSSKIDDELKAYAALPPADVNDPVTFEVNLRKRLDALMLTSASCTFYQTTLQQAQSPGQSQAGTKP